MPIYCFSNPKKPSQIKEIIMTMSEPHEYEENGVKWDRVWTKPQAAVSTQIDPFSQQQFVEKVGAANNGKMKDIWDRSEELSRKRADKAGGTDPVKQKYYDEYAKTRKGKRHPKEIREKIDNTTITI